jgi:hypothetical protein
LDTLKTNKYKDREPVKIKFLLISTIRPGIPKKYGLIHSCSTTTNDARDVFIYAPDNNIGASPLIL